MVTLQDLIDNVLIDSGQFFVDFDDTLMDRKIFVSIIKRALQLYNRYYPLVENKNFSLYNNKVFCEKKDGVVPDTIIQIRGNYGNNYTAWFTNGSVRQFNIISSLNWKYYKPKLFFQYVEGCYDVQYLVYHKWNDLTKSIDTLDNTFPGTQRYFMDLVSAMFMIALGKSRTAFTVSGLPVDTNANDLISTGQELYNTTNETMRENSYFHLAVMV